MKKSLQIWLIFNIIAVILIAITLVLEILPHGVEMVFKTTDGTVVKYYSYFSLMPMGYGDFCPLLAIALTIGLLICIPLSLIFQKKSGLTLLPLILGSALVLFTLLQLIFSQTTINYSMIGFAVLSLISLVLGFRFKVNKSL